MAMHIKNQPPRNLGSIGLKWTQRMRVRVREKKNQPRIHVCTHLKWTYECDAINAKVTIWRIHTIKVNYHNKWHFVCACVSFCECTNVEQRYCDSYELLIASLSSVMLSLFSQTKDRICSGTVRECFAFGACV